MLGFLRTLTFTLAVLTLPILVPASPVHANTETQISYAALFDEAWRVTRDRFYDPGMAGLDWQAVGDKYRPKAEASSSSAEFAAVINAMLSELGASHMGYFTPADPAYYQHLAARQQRRGVAVACCRHAACAAPGVARRVVELGNGNSSSLE